MTGVTVRVRSPSDHGRQRAPQVGGQWSRSMPSRSSTTLHDALDLTRDREGDPGAERDREGQQPEVSVRLLL